ncbi:thioredoxin family protein [Brachyspira murdochii]|uniref:thioredoxin family protein n=1 Tax=Brachyspira murdochii TaxID=84378 RepID=UPI003006E0ED
MNKLYLIILCFITFVSCSNSKINWEDDFDKAIEKSKSENKPIMMDIYTDWCGACKEMDKTTFKNKEVSDYTTNFIALKFNPEKSSNGDALLKKYNIPGFPTMLFMNSDGFVIKRIIGYIESDELINEMSSIKQKEENIKNAFKDDTPSIEKLDIYIDSGYAKEASDMYDILIKENKIPEDSITKYMSKIAVMLLDNDDYENGMRYFNEIIDKYNNQKEVYIAHYYKALDMIINNGQTNEGIKYIENLTNEAPEDIKEQYINLIDYFNLSE